MSEKLLPETSSNPPQTPVKKNGEAMSVMAFIFGILSLIACGPFTGIPAIVLGHLEIKEIEKGISSQANRGLAKAGMILGIISTSIYALMLLILIGVFLFTVIAGKQLLTTNF